METKGTFTDGLWYSPLGIAKEKKYRSVIVYLSQKLNEKGIVTSPLKSSPSPSKESKRETKEEDEHPSVKRISQLEEEVGSKEEQIRDLRKEISEMKKQNEEQQLKLEQMNGNHIQQMEMNDLMSLRESLTSSLRSVEDQVTVLYLFLTFLDQEERARSQAVCYLFGCRQDSDDQTLWTCRRL